VNALVKQNCCDKPIVHFKRRRCNVYDVLEQRKRGRSREVTSWRFDYAETRFSRLNQINTDNVKKLGLVRDPSGEFELSGVLPGKYVLYANAPDLTNRGTGPSAQRAIEVSEDLTRLATEGLTAAEHLLKLKQAARTDVLQARIQLL